MPSHLRLQSSFEEPITAHATYQTSPKLPPAKKQKMSLTQTYYIASTARSKLGREASKADHNLRRLVAHANTLDTLMEELSRAEQEQSAWFDESIRKASQPEQPRRVQWMDTVAEQYEEEDSESDDESDADSDYDEEEELFNLASNIKSAAIELEDDRSEVDEDEEEEELQLRRSPSQHSPPELTHDDSESESEDEAPSSPEDAVLPLSEKQRQAIATTALFELKSQRQGMEDYVQQQQQQQPCIAAC